MLGGKDVALNFNSKLELTLGGLCQNACYSYELNIHSV